MPPTKNKSVHGREGHNNNDDTTKILKSWKEKNKGFVYGVVGAASVASATLGRAVGTSSPAPSCPLAPLPTAAKLEPRTPCPDLPFALGAGASGRG
ncbi:hypothetical protein TYRP_008493 [Tyrophagus putrescentiae]|nr:hypothetical protein TYRP_008493 [Tyrophagus putrescentiae]